MRRIYTIGAMFCKAIDRFPHFAPPTIGMKSKNMAPQHPIRNHERAVVPALNSILSPLAVKLHEPLESVHAARSAAEGGTSEAFRIG